MPGIRVLVVDDSVVVRKVLCEALTADSTIEVAGTAADGHIALSKIPMLKPDLITLDIEMPGMSGLETLAEIRKLYPKLPVIMVSTLTERELRSRWTRWRRERATTKRNHRTPAAWNRHGYGFKRNWCQR
jgi:two-component system chemotaxis response regulator CheB